MRSPTTRLSALALAAIVAPATIVAILGYVSLRQWESSAELLFREQARDVATMAAEKVEMMLRLAEDAFLDRLQASARGGDVAEPALDRIVAESPAGAPALRVRARRLAALPTGLARPGRRRPVRRGAARRACRPCGSAGASARSLADGQVCLVVLLRPGREPVLVAYVAGHRGPAPRHSRDVAGRAGVADDRGRARSARGARSTRASPLEPRRAGAGRAVARGAAELARGGVRAAGRLAARTWCAARSCSSRAPSGCWWRSSWPAWCSRGG